MLPPLATRSRRSVTPLPARLLVLSPDDAATFVAASPSGLAGADRSEKGRVAVNHRALRVSGCGTRRLPQSYRSNFTTVSALSKIRTVDQADMLWRSRARMTITPHAQEELDLPGSAIGPAVKASHLDLAARYATKRELLGRNNGSFDKAT